MNTLRVLALTITTLAALTASASRALSISRQITLADGRTVTARLIGDERVSFYLSTDNEMILRQGDTYVIATPEQKDSIRTLCDVEVPTAKAKTAISGSIPPLGEAEGGVTQGNSEGPQWTRTCPTMGTVRIPVILVDFSDGVSFTFDKEALDDYFNSTELKAASPYSKQKTYYSNGSVAEYFRYCSNGLFNPVFEIYGPYRVSYKSTDFGQSARLEGFAMESIRLADKDIDFSQYDSNGDGYIDNIMILYAGYGSHANAGDKLIWPMASNVASSALFDGKRAYRYCASNELALYPDFSSMAGGPRLSTGTVCHEFCHTLGLPDFYPTVNWSNMSYYDNQSMEEWSLMDYGGWALNSFAPTPLTAWERAFLGWGGPLEELSTPDDVTMKPLKDGGQAYVVRNDANPREYYVLEAMPRAEGWYRAMQNTGLLITHTVWDAGAVYSNTVNNTVGKPKHTVMAADGRLLSSYNAEGNGSIYYTELAGDTYPYGDVNSFTDYKAYTGTIDKPLTDIAKTPDGTVTFRFMGGLLWGDVDGDGEVTMSDANLVVNYYLGIVSELTNTKAADLDHDGVITMSDANAIVNLYLGSE